MNALELIKLPVLVLNQNYEPLNVCRVRRAMVLLYYGKAEMLENGTGFIHSASYSYAVPSVIKLASMIKRPRQQHRKLTRLEIFHRDQYTCQYCGKQTHQLTLDHVLPRYRGGEHTWENVVSACIPCNRHKAGKTPSEAGMQLIHRPAPPKDRGFFYLPHNHEHIHSQWQKYLPQ